MNLDSNNISNTLFYTTIKDMVHCTICTEIMFKPQQCLTCETCYCKKCINNWIKRSDSCPMKCPKPTFKDSRITNNMLSKLVFKCPNKCEGGIPYDKIFTHEVECSKSYSNMQYNTQQFYTNSQNYIQPKIEVASMDQFNNVPKVNASSNISQQISYSDYCICSSDDDSSDLVMAPYNQNESNNALSLSMILFLTYTNEELRSMCCIFGLKVSGNKAFLVDGICAKFRNNLKKFLNAKTKDDLKKICRVLNVIVSGNKDELIKRIIKDANNKLKQENIH